MIKYYNNNNEQKKNTKKQTRGLLFTTCRYRSRTVLLMRKKIIISYSDLYGSNVQPTMFNVRRGSGLACLLRLTSSLTA